MTIALRAALDVLRGEADQPARALQFDPPDAGSGAPDDELDRSLTVAWYVEQLEPIIEHELRGFGQIVAEADLAAGGRADTELLARQHGKKKNVAQATRSKVWKKIRETIRQREALRDSTKVNP